ncbi:MAG: type III polyketide synthase [Myxococcales bacterium]|nr:type III polyketide synthase [Myxococcales bacterium]MCB9539453.1 type III polyketide synthase [Myxococcales bacterium]
MSRTTPRGRVRIIDVGRAFPPHYYDQQTLADAFAAQWPDAPHRQRRVAQFHEAVGVGGRHLALPLERYLNLDDFGAANDAWIEVGLQVGEAALRDAMARARVDWARVGAIFSVSVTGVATPSLEARLMNRVPALPRHLKRVPIFGLGCVAGAAGLARAADYVRAFPDEIALVLSVELCSLTLQRQDPSVANLISAGLFGDGAACAVVAGAYVPAEGPVVVATRSVFFDDTERVMGWDISGDGFRVVLDKSVPDVVRARLRPAVDAFLADHGRALADLGSFVCHPGGPKVIEAMETALDAPPEALELARRSLAEVGNLSSASVLMVLRDTLERRRPAPGTLGLLAALGPGFCAELVLLRW